MIYVRTVAHLNTPSAGLSLFLPQSAMFSPLEWGEGVKIKLIKAQFSPKIAKKAGNSLLLYI